MAKKKYNRPSPRGAKPKSDAKPINPGSGRGGGAIGGTKLPPRDGAPATKPGRRRGRKPR